MQEFARIGRAKCETKLLEHLQAAFPEWAATQGESRLRAFIRVGIERANHNGFRTERDVARYLNLMHALGPNFDTSRNQAWARDILDKTTLSTAERLDRLADAVRYRRQAETISNIVRRRPRAPTPSTSTTR